MVTPQEALWDYWLDIAKELDKNPESRKNLNHCLMKIDSEYQLCKGEVETLDDGTNITTWRGIDEGVKQKMDWSYALMFEEEVDARLGLEELDDANYMGYTLSGEHMNIVVLDTDDVDYAEHLQELAHNGSVLIRVKLKGE